MVNSDEINMDVVSNHFNGRDPLQELGALMDMLDSTQMKALVMIACNQLASSRHDTENSTMNENVIQLGEAIDSVVKAYFAAGGGMASKFGMMFQ